MKNSIKTLALTLWILAWYANSTANTVSALEKNFDKKTVFKEHFSKNIVNVMEENNYTNSDIDELLDIPATDSLAFGNVYKLQLFVELLRCNSFINPIFVSREEFDSKNGDFLIKTNEGKNDVAKKYAYNLYLPNNLKIWELVMVIQKINELIYGDKQPNYSFSKTFKKDVEAVISYLISIRTEENKNEVNALIGDYRVLLEQYYSNEPIDSLSTYEKKWDEDVVNGIKKLRSGNLNFSQARIDTIMSDAIYRNLYLSIFEYGSEILDDVWGLETTLWIPALKKNLDLVKKQKNAVNTSATEKQILKKILTEIDKLDLQEGREFDMDSLLAASSPSSILETKKILCIGKSILLHNILQKIWIKHYALELLWHSAIMVECSNGEQFYIDMDVTGSMSLKMTKIREFGIREQMKIGKDTALVVRWNPDKLLLAQQIGNMSNVYSISDLEEAKYNILYMENAIKLSENIPFSHYTLVWLYFETGAYQKALKSINKALELDPNYDLSRWLKAQICGKLKDYDWYNAAYRKYQEISKTRMHYKSFNDLEKKRAVLKEAKEQKK